MTGNQDPIFRELRVDDKEAISTLFRQLIFHEDRFNINDCLSQENVHTVVIEMDGLVVGFGCMIIDYSPTKGFYARLDEIIVDSSYRRRGLGKRLMGRLIDLAKEHIKDLKLITLTSNSRRVEAITLYKSVGFEIYHTNVFELKT